MESQPHFSFSFENRSAVLPINVIFWKASIYPTSFPAAFNNKRSYTQMCV